MKLKKKSKNVKLEIRVLRYRTVVESVLITGTFVG